MSIPLVLTLLPTTIYSPLFLQFITEMEKQNHILVYVYLWTKVSFVLRVQSVLLQLCHDSCARFDILEAQHLSIQWQKAIKFSEISDGVLWRAGWTLVPGQPLCLPHQFICDVQCCRGRVTSCKLVALCHSFAMKRFLLGIWLLLLDGRELCPGVSGGRTRGTSSFCCTSVIAMAHSQLLTVRSQWLSISWELDDASLSRTWTNHLTFTCSHR